jgi:protein-S-isoprenylcysteine O-methyltransferase Ste14
MNGNLTPLAIFLSMTAWGVFHSWLAAFSTKEQAYRYCGERLRRSYRLIFVGVAILTLSPILVMVILLPARVLWSIPTPWLYLTLLLQTIALLGLVITVLQVDTLAFIGLRQLRHPDVEMKTELVTRGFYRWVRHPLYFFSLVIFWLMPIMTDLSLAFIMASTLYFIVGTIPEERKLVKIFGEGYRQYQQDVPRIIPWLKRL